MLSPPSFILPEPFSNSPVRLTSTSSMSGNTPVPYTDFISLIKTYVDKRWPLSWDKEVNNKLYNIQPLIHTQPLCNLPRRDEILIHRLRVGHTHLTHSYLLKKEHLPQCTNCKVPLTIRHILIDCAQYTSQRIKFYTVPTLCDLFKKIPYQKIVDFIKHIGFYRRLKLFILILSVLIFNLTPGSTLILVTSSFHISTLK